MKELLNIDELQRILGTPPLPLLSLYEFLQLIEKLYRKQLLLDIK